MPGKLTGCEHNCFQLPNRYFIQIIAAVSCFINVFYSQCSKLSLFLVKETTILLVLVRVIF